MSKSLRTTLIILAVLLVVLLIGPFLVPVPPLDTVPPHALADPDSRFITLNVRGTDVDVHYKQRGAGERTFLLLHGFASSTFSWREVMQPLSAYGTVIALDWLPYGLSERPPRSEWGGDTPYSREAQVELVIDLMDALGVERAILIGNSAGGALAAQVAYQYPERVEALVLVSAAVFPPGSRPPAGGPHGNRLLAFLWPAVRWLGTTPQMQRIGPLLVRGIREQGVELGRSAWHDPSRLTEEIWEGYQRPLKVENWDVGLYEAILALDPQDEVAEHLDTVNMPTLVVTGDDDRIVPTANSVALADALPNAHLVIFKDCGHIPQEECPHQFMQAIADFLLRLDS